MSLVYDYACTRSTAKNSSDNLHLLLILRAIIQLKRCVLKERDSVRSARHTYRYRWAGGLPVLLVEDVLMTCSSVSTGAQRSLTESTQLLTDHERRAGGHHCCHSPPVHPVDAVQSTTWWTAPAAAGCWRTHGWPGRGQSGFVDVPPTVYCPAFRLPLGVVVLHRRTSTKLK